MLTSTIGILSSIIFASPSVVERFEGVARDEDGAVRYRERHEVHRVGELTRWAVTRYFDAQGHPIGELRSEYGNDPYAPSYTFSDASGRTLEAAQLRGGAVHLRYRDRVQVLPIERSRAQLVLGQGLDRLARDHLQALARGERMSVRFAIPSRFDLYEFRIQRIDGADRDVVRLRVEIDNWFLAMIAPSLEVDYDRRNGRLLAYRGVSNLEDEHGDTQKVNIRYHYPAQTEVAK